MLERKSIIDKAFTRREVDLLLQEVDRIEDEVLIRLAVTTGMRRLDVASIEIKNIDLKEGNVTFHEHMKKRWRTLTLSLDVLKAMKMYLNSLSAKDRKRKYLFPFMDRAAYNHLRVLCDRAGIPRRPFHALRGTCVKLCQEAGWSVVETAKLVGDTVAVVQLHYTTPSDAELAEAVREKAIL
jgi:integrase